MSRQQAKKVGTDLTAIVKGDVLSDIFNRVAYSTDASIYQILPLCVVCPKDTADVIAVVKYAASSNIPVCGRGAGSGVAGESLTKGIVIDFRRHMNKIIDITDAASRVTCQPGTVLADLNNYLAKFGKKIGPDPSSGNRAVIGGVVANNATGAHSLQYGYIAQHVSKIETVLADGSLAVFQNNTDPAQQSGTAAAIAKKCFEILDGKDEIINAALPGTKRNRSGYNIAGICHDGKIDIPKLLTGSEGTLGIFTQITLQTVDLPKAKGLLQLEFDTFESMARAVPVIVAGGAATCELMDRKVMDLALETLPEYADIFPRQCQAVLLIEQTAETEDHVKAKIDKCVFDVGDLSSGQKTFYDPAEQDRIWKSRKDAVPLLSRIKGKSSPIPFIEDVSVENTKLAEYIAGMLDIGKKYDFSLAAYGHAGDGELHLRPYLDLSEKSDIQKMKNIADDVFALAWSLGGTISGEHADGLVRAAFIKKQYGEQFYQLLQEIKNAFDPAGLMNPGKILSDDPDVMVNDLRAAGKPRPYSKSHLNFGPNEFVYEIAQCSGCGVCASTQKPSGMCPVFRAMGDELASSRAKANLLRAWLTGIIDRQDFESPEFKTILSLCVNCKRCALECPSGVDVSKLIIEARSQLAAAKGFSVTERLLANNRCLSKAGSLFVPVSNFFMSLPIFKWFLEKIAGFDKRRAMPRFSGGSFIPKGRKYIKALPPIKDPKDKVAYFIDTYAAYNDHGLARAVIDCLHHNDIEVTLPDQLPAPLPAIVYGDLKTARKDLKFNIESLARSVRAGCKIICSEPSAALCLKEELRLLDDSEDAKLVSQNTYELMDYLHDLNARGKLKRPSQPSQERFVYHTPCHLKALGAEGRSVELLTELFVAEIIRTGAGCCGLSGTYGMQKKNYDLSVEIGAEMADAVNAADAPQAMTECAACKMQIDQLTDKEAVHPIKVLAGAYGLRG